MGCTCASEVHVAPPQVVVPAEVQPNQQQQRQENIPPCFFCETTAVSRILCPSKTHAYCKDCFENLVASWCDPVLGGCGKIRHSLLPRVAPAGTAEFQNEQMVEQALSLVGQVPCSNDDGSNCKAFFQPRNIKKFVSPVMKMQYESACNFQKEKLVLEKARLVPGAKTTDAPSPAEGALLTRDRSAREIYLEEDLLNLSCPSCGFAICDFDGCFALQCVNCEKYFCAWCMSYTGGDQDTHAHVGQCSENPLPDKSLWSTMDVFVVHHHQRRLKLIGDFFKDQSDRRELADRVAPLLRSSLGEGSWTDLRRQVSTFSVVSVTSSSPVVAPSPTPNSSTAAEVAEEGQQEIQIRHPSNEHLAAPEELPQL